MRDFTHSVRSLFLFQKIQKMSTTKNNKILVILAFIGIYLIWGTTFLAIFFGLKGFPPFILSGFRFLLAGILLLGFLYFKGEAIFTLQAWRKNALSGILILTVGVGSVTWAEQYISSTEAAIVIASEPFWFILLDKKNRNFYFQNKIAISGLLIGFIGLIIFFNDSLNLNGVAANGSLRTLSFVILLFSAIVWVLGSLNSKKETGQSIFTNVGQQLVAGGLVSLLVAAVRGEFQVINVSTIPFEAWAGLFYLIFFGSILAYLSYIWLLSIKPAALVSTHTFVNPLVAVFAGSIFANEQISSWQTVGIVVILVGVVLTNIVQLKISRRFKVKLRNVARKPIFSQTINLLSFKLLASSSK